MANESLTREDSNYVYEPLDQARKEIRLLKLSQNSTNSFVHCTIERASFLDTPNFMALSYVWGKPEPAERHIIFVDGSIFPITKNLLAALLNIIAVDLDEE